MTFYGKILHYLSPSFESPNFIIVWKL